MSTNRRHGHHIAVVVRRDAPIPTGGSAASAGRRECPGERREGAGSAA